MERADEQYPDVGQSESSADVLESLVPHPYQSLSPDGEIIAVNDAWLDAFGYSRSEVLGRYAHEFLANVSPREFEEILDHLKTHGCISDREYEIRTASGDSVYVSYDGTVEYDDSGAAIRTHCQFTDITEIKERERELRQYKQAVDGSTAMLAAVDVDETILFANRQYREFHGLDRTDVSGEHIADVLDEDVYEEVRPILDRVAEGKTVATETERRGPDGEMATLAVRYYPLEDLDGTVYGTVAAMRDVTDRKRRETELGDLYRTYRDFFDGIGDAVFVHRPDGEMLAVNETACNRLGYDESELLEMTARDIDTAEDADRYEERRSAIESDGTATFETRHETESGEEIPVEVAASAIYYFGDPAILSVARDVSARKTYETQLREQRDNLEILNKVLRHDIRNDLQLVTAYADMLEQGVDDDHREYAATVKEKASHAVDLTNAARNMADLLLSEDDVRKPIEARPMLQAEIAEARSGYPAATISLEGEIPDVAVLADDMLDAVFGNLLQNAIQHNDTAEPRVTVTAARHQDALRISIADNGPGVTDERKRAIFGEGEKGLESAGTGIGLYLVDSLVDSYDGSVWVEDNEPTGSIFHVELPIAE